MTQSPQPEQDRWDKPECNCAPSLELEGGVDSYGCPVHDPKHYRPAPQPEKRCTCQDLHYAIESDCPAHGHMVGTPLHGTAGETGEKPTGRMAYSDAEVFAFIQRMQKAEDKYSALSALCENLEKCVNADIEFIDDIARKVFNGENRKSALRLIELNRAALSAFEAFRKDNPK